MLVWVASYPRSGNTLTTLTLRDAYGIGRLGAYFGKEEDLRLGRFARELYPQLDEAPWRPSPELCSLPRAELFEAVRERPEPFFIKTHRLDQAKTPDPTLYLVRDGRDSLVSQAHQIMNRNPKAFRGLSYNRRIARLIQPGIATHGTWSQSVRTWRRRSAPTAIIRFEDLIVDPVEAIARGCRELSISLPDVTGQVPPFSELRQANPNVYRRGEVGGWRHEMPDHLHKRFWRVHGVEMVALGYTDGRP